MAAEIHANAIIDIYERLTALETQVANLLLDATVTAVHADKNLVDVDVNGLSLPEIPYLTMRAGAGKTYWMPSVGESGMLLVPSGDVGNARFLPAQTTDKNRSPESKENKLVIIEGGSKIEVDGEEIKTTSEKLSVTASKEVKVESDVVSIKIQPSRLEMKVGAQWIVLTKALANINGATFAGGVTNMASNAPVGYVPVLP